MTASLFTDTRDRRLALGASEEIVAAGIGLRRADLRAMERGEAPQAMLKYYAGWLATMEQWSVEEREIQYMAARVGRRFVRAR